MKLKDLIEDTQKNHEVKETNPIELFNLANRKKGYAYLRANQKEFLDIWNKRRTEKDIIGILNTGAGKTLIGLLMLKSKMLESGLPSLYLCPTKQLVEQVYKQANNYGIQTCVTASDDWENDFYNADKILITTFDKLFNGKSVFGIKGFSEPKKIGSIVIDDAHACIKSARKQSTITINKEEKYYQTLLSIFSIDLKYQSEGKYRAIVNGEKSVCTQVPYWTWINNIDIVKKELADMSMSENPHVFSYRMISDILDYCQCYISGDKIEITPRNIPVERVPSFFEAEHRFILSATLNNEDLYSELNIDKDAISNPIITDNSTVDIGERLIISPTKYHKELSDSFMREKIVQFSNEKKQNTIVIVPSNYQANLWKELGVTITDAESIVRELKSLNQSSGKVIVLVNRYDGIDIPEDLSHVLVLDGLPGFSTNREKVILSDTITYDWKASQLAQRIEQGLGRTVRSVTDYSVVFLLGDALSNFVGRKEYLKYFSPALQKQLELSKELRNEKFNNVGEALNEIFDSIDLSLSRNPKWIEYSKEVLKTTTTPVFDINNFRMYIEEQDIYRLLIDGKLHEADIKVNNIINSDISDEIKTKYTQLLAEIKYYSDMDVSLNLQVKAYEAGDWKNIFKPQTKNIKKKIKGNNSQVYAVYKTLVGFSSSVDFKIHLDNILRTLIYSNEQSSDEFEEAIEKLGTMLGFESIRPEKIWIDGGPDNLWTTESYSILIECKNRRTQDKIVKGDIEQLLASAQWYSNTYHDSSEHHFNLMFHKSAIVANDAPLLTKDGFVVPTEKLQVLKERLTKFRDSILSLGIENVDLSKVDTLLRQNKLCVSMLYDDIFVPFRK